MNRVWLLAGIALLSLGCIQQPDASAPANGQQALQNFEARLALVAPFSEASVDVMDEGLVKYNVAYSANLQRPGVSRDIVVEQAKAQELKSLVLSSGFLQLQPTYLDSSLADATKHVIEVTLGNSVKRVECTGTCPSEFLQVEDAIRNLWGQEIEEVGT